jgi:methyl-accepting chemotaxis protein
MKALTIGGRINLLALVTMAGLLVITGLSLMRLDAAMRADIAASTKGSVEIAYSVVAHYQAEEQAGRLSRVQAQDAAKAASAPCVTETTTISGSTTCIPPW